MAFRISNKNFILVLSIFSFSNSKCILLKTIYEVGLIMNAMDKMNEFNRNLFYNAVKGNLNQINSSESNQQTENNNDQDLDIFNVGASSNLQNAVPAFTRSRINNAAFSDLAGFIPEDVTEVIDFLKNPRKFLHVGAHMPKGILLVGPPGCGKTSIARAIANEIGGSFFESSGSQFVELYVGVGPKRVRELFDAARATTQKGGKAVIFIDEIDAIGRRRNGGISDCQEYRNTLNELLNQMDGFAQNPSICVIAATNRHVDLDSALLRPGRFDRIVEVKLPDEESRKKIFIHYCNKVRTKKGDINFDELAKQTNSFSPAEIKNLVNEAAIRAARESSDFVGSKHFEQAFQNEKKRRSLNKNNQ